MANVQAIRAALDEMDRLAAAHIAIQSDKTAQIKDVRKAEQLRDRHEAYVEREGRATWLRDLLAERERLLTVMREVADMGTLRPDQFNFGEAAARLTYMRDRLRRELAALDTEGAGHE